LKLNPLLNRGGHFPLGPKKQRENNGLLSEYSLLGFNPNASSSSTQSLLDFNPNASSFSTQSLLGFKPNAFSSSTQSILGFNPLHPVLHLKAF
jgi:hypothetical protein